LQRFFHTQGVNVSGYDKNRNALTKEMEAAGIAIHSEEIIDMAPKDAETGYLYTRIQNDIGNCRLP